MSITDRRPRYTSSPECRVHGMALVVMSFVLVLILAGNVARAAEEGKAESVALSAIDYAVYPAVVESGERELEVRGWRHIDGNNELDGSGALKLAVGTAITDFWFLEPYLEFEKEGSKDLQLEAVEIENRFQLTPQGKYWLDVGLLVEGEFNANGEDKQKLRYGPLLEKQFGRTVVTTNLLLQNQFGSDAEHHDDTLFSYAANVRYLYAPAIEPGVSAYGGIGALGDPEKGSEQVHQVGPSIRGKFSLGPGSVLKYRTGVVFGLTSGSPDATWIGHLEYEF